MDARPRAVLVAVIREQKKQTFERVNAQGTANVAAAAKEAGVGHLIDVSAIGVDPGEPQVAPVHNVIAG